MTKAKSKPSNVTELVIMYHKEYGWMELNKLANCVSQIKDNEVLFFKNPVIYRLTGAAGEYNLTDRYVHWRIKILS